MDDKSGFIFLLLISLLFINNAIFKGLEKEHRIYLGIMGAITFIGSICGFFII